MLMVARSSDILCANLHDSACAGTGVGIGVGGQHRAGKRSRLLPHLSTFDSSSSRAKKKKKKTGESA
jgi:hypothetical protein